MLELVLGTSKVSGQNTLQWSNHDSGQNRYSGQIAIVVKLSEAVKSSRVVKTRYGGQTATEVKFSEVVNLLKWSNLYSR